MAQDSTNKGGVVNALIIQLLVVVVGLGLLASYESIRNRHKHEVEMRKLKFAQRGWEKYPPASELKKLSDEDLLVHGLHVDRERAKRSRHWQDTSNRQRDQEAEDTSNGGRDDSGFHALCMTQQRQGRMNLQ